MHQPHPEPHTRAIAHVTALASGPTLDPTLPVTLNFHPDRFLNDRPVLTALAEDGVYRSQFVTGTSNGGLTAHPGGARWQWESRIFGGAYDTAPAEARPVYGALDFRGSAAGAAPDSARPTSASPRKPSPGPPSATRTAIWSRSPSGSPPACP